MGECFFWYRPILVVPDQRPLNGRCCCYLGLPGWVGTRRNIHPLTSILIIRHPLSTSSIYYDPYYPSCSINVPDSPFHNLTPGPLGSVFFWSGTLYFILQTFYLPKAHIHAHTNTDTDITCMGHAKTTKENTK